MAMTPEEATAALEALIRGIDPLTSDPIAFIDGIEEILDDTVGDDTPR